MSKRLNERFLTSYIELDRNCCDKFGVATGGVTEYINRLNNARFAPDREDVLPRLVRYRGIRNKMVHDVGSLRRESEVTKNDIKWVRRFSRHILKGKDPISVYLRKARSYARRRLIMKIFVISLISLFAASVLVLLIMLGAK